jgi:hypothetical protein
VRSDLIRAVSIAGAFWFSVAPAAAQQTPSGRSGTEVPTALDHVLVNGALAVPGAPVDSDMVPAKFSPKNAADDALVTLGYTFKSLSAEERRAVYEALPDQPPAAAGLKADVGTALPSSVELAAVPDDVAAKVPQIRGYQYAVADGRVLLVWPPARVVTGVLDGK